MFIRNYNRARALRPVFTGRRARSIFMQMYPLGAANDRPFYSCCSDSRSHRLACVSLRGRSKLRSIAADVLAARVALWPGQVTGSYTDIAGVNHGWVGTP